MKLDVQMFKGGDMEAAYEAAFAAFYGVDVMRAEDMLRMYLLRRASPLIHRYSKSSNGALTWHIQKSSSVLTTFAIVLANDVNCLAIRARFLAKVERALPEELEALDGRCRWRRTQGLTDAHRAGVPQCGGAGSSSICHGAPALPASGMIRQQRGSTSGLWRSQ